MSRRLLFCIAIGLAAQVPAVRYEAASIKPSKAGGARRLWMEFLPGGRFRSMNTPLLPVLATAYNVPFASIESLRLRMKGVPDWVLGEPYDIEATAGPGSVAAGASAKARNGHIRLMLQSVLADRLQLKIRRNFVEMPIYALTVIAHGPKLTRSTVRAQDCSESAPFGGTACHQFQGGAGRGLRALAIDMADLALYLSGWSERPIVDQTGLSGLYAIQTEGWADEWASPGGDPSRQTLGEMLDQLGLKLIKKRGPVEVYVVEHIERPSGN